MRARVAKALLIVAAGLWFGGEVAYADDVSGAASTFATITPEDAGFSAKKLRALDEFADEQIKAGEFPGVVVRLTRHGRTVLEKAYGARSFGGDAVSTDAIYRAYSMTKPVTGLAMMILYEEGKWQLDDPITKYIPEFSGFKVFRELGPDGKPIVEDLKRPATMRELISHSAGFAYGLAPTDPVSKAYFDEKLFLSEDLAAFVGKVAKLPLAYQPGLRWQYSVSNDLEGYVIEKLSGKSLDAFFKEKIFDPLRMYDSGFFVAPGKIDRLLPVYALDPKTEKVVEVSGLGDFSKRPTLFSGGGGMVTTAADYARFCQALLNGGELDGVRIASPETIKLMDSNLLPQDVWVTGENRTTMVKGLGYGAGVAVVTDPAALGSPSGEGTMSWGGAAGTYFWVDPKNDLHFVWMVQRFGVSEEVRDNLIRIVYAALNHPEL